MDHNHDIELIEKLLQNELPESERQALEERIRQQADLANEYERRRRAHHALDFLIAQNLKQELQSLEEEGKVVAIRLRRRTLTYILSVAAGVLLLIGAFAVIFPGETLPNELADTYYVLPEFSSQRSAEPSGEQESALSSGVEALGNEAYDQAINILEAIPEQDENYLSARYYLGHAYYLSSRFTLAEKSFKVVISGNDIRYQEEAEWYALMACLKQDEANCSELVERIAGNSSHLYNQNALKIQRSLK